MNRFVLCLASASLCVLGTWSSSTLAANAVLFSASPSTRASAALATDASYQAIVQDPAAVSVKLIDADALAVDSATSSLRLLLDGSEVRAERDYSVPLDGGMVLWSGSLPGARSTLSRLRLYGAGEIANDPMNAVMIVRNGNRLTGTIRRNGQLYELRPLRSGGHALVKIDESRMPPDHPRAYARLPIIDMPAAAAMSAKPDLVTAAAATTIRVMAMVTTSAANASGDYQGLINLAVAESNQGYANSGVDISLVLAGAYTINYTESGSFSTDLSRFRGTSDGYMDSIHATRNTIAADVGVLVINNSSSCGLASSIGSTASTAFAAVHYSCATGYYSFAHEIGHLQSARHDPAADSSSSPYAYGHGYRYDAGHWRTIMAYDCPTGCTRLNYWSNPGNTYGGVAMGTTTGNDNHRVLNNTRATVAAFR